MKPTYYADLAGSRLAQPGELVARVEGTIKGQPVVLQAVEPAHRPMLLADGTLTPISEGEAWNSRGKDQ